MKMQVKGNLHKTVSLLLVLSIFVFTFSGCIKAEYEVKNLTVIQGIGIDYDNDTKQYKVAIEIFDISQSSGMGESESGNLTKIIETSGESVSDAINKIELEIGKTLIYSQKRAIVIGKTAMERGLTDALAFFLKDYKTRSSVLVAVCTKCSAKDIIRADEGDASFPSREIQTLLQSGKINGYTTEVDVAMLTQMTEKNSPAVYIPILDIKKEKKEDKTAKYTCLDGIAIIKDDKIAGELSLSEGRGLLFLNDQVDSGPITINNKEIGMTTLEIVKSSTKVKTEAKTKQHFTVNIKCVVDVVERQKMNANKSDKEDATEIAKATKRYIKEYTEKALGKCLDDYKSDVFSFGRRLWILYPKFYRNMKDRTIQSEDVTVNVDIEVRHISNSNE